MEAFVSGFMAGLIALAADRLLKRYLDYRRSHRRTYRTLDGGPPGRRDGGVFYELSDRPPPNPAPASAPPPPFRPDYDLIGHLEEPDCRDLQ